MDTFAVAIFPIADEPGWKEFVDSASSGDRAEAHRGFLRRIGVKREHIHRQDTPMGAVMVLVWEGVEQDKVGEIMADLVQNPQSDHERHIVNHVIPKLHGVDLSAGPPPEMKRVATTES